MHPPPPHLCTIRLFEPTPRIRANLDFFIVWGHTLILWAGSYNKYGTSTFTHSTTHKYVVGGDSWSSAPCTWFEDSSILRCILFYKLSNSLNRLTQRNEQKEQNFLKLCFDIFKSL